MKFDANGAASPDSQTEAQAFVRMFAASEHNRFGDRRMLASAHDSAQAAKVTCRALDLDLVPSRDELQDSFCPGSRCRGSGPGGSTNDALGAAADLTADIYHPLYYDA